MPTINSRLYPYQDINEHDVISLYSTLNTGLAGTLVKIVTGAANPQNADGFSSTAVGGNYNTAGVYLFSNRYETKMKVEPTAAGDTAFNALGFTRLSTLETDPNGLPLKMFPQRAKELGVVVSGETVPIITNGIIGIWGKYIDQANGSVQPGNLAVVSASGDGLIAAISPSNTAKFGVTGQLYNPNQVVGKFLTSLPTATNTGLSNEFSAQGGYALIKLTLNA